MSEYTIEQLKEFSKSESWRERRKVAKHPNCPVYILDNLSKDNNFWVKKAVAINKNSTEEILKEMNKDQDWEIRLITSLELWSRFNV